MNITITRLGIDIGEIFQELDGCWSGMHYNSGETEYGFSTKKAAVNFVEEMEIQWQDF